MKISINEINTDSGGSIIRANTVVVDSTLVGYYW